jgi:hypothetical protein
MFDPPALCSSTRRSGNPGARDGLSLVLYEQSRLGLRAYSPVFARHQLPSDGKLFVRPAVLSGFVENGILEEAHGRRDDRAGDAAASQLPGLAPISKPPAPLAALPRAGMSPDRIEPPIPPPAAPAMVLPRRPRLMFIKRPPAAFPPTAPPIS